jgi:hypothetical protein
MSRGTSCLFAVSIVICLPFFVPVWMCQFWTLLRPIVSHVNHFSKSVTRACLYPCNLLVKHPPRPLTPIGSTRRPLWREDGSVRYSCSWTWPAQSFSGLSSDQIQVILRPTARRQVCSGTRPQSGTSDQFFFLSTDIIFRHFLFFCTGCPL